MYMLTRTQTFPIPPLQLWEFIENPLNLNDITPPDLCFQIVSEVPQRMYEGLIIEYRLKVPWFGRQSWLTEIKHIVRPGSFVDEQRVGPYRFWYHYHEIVEVEGGTRMIDRVHYQMPYGFLGRVLHYAVVQRTLERIFEYRFNELAKRFGSLPDLAEVERWAGA